MVSTSIESVEDEEVCCPRITARRRETAVDSGMSDTCERARTMFDCGTGKLVSFKLRILREFEDTYPISCSSKIARETTFELILANDISFEQVLDNRNGMSPIRRCG